MFILNQQSKSYEYSKMQSNDKLILNELENKFYSVAYDSYHETFAFTELNKYTKGTVFKSGKFGILNDKISKFFRPSNFKARMELNIENRLNMLIHGSTGTGKSHNIMNALNSYLSSKNAVGLYITEKTPFSKISDLITLVRIDKPECFIFIVFDEFEKTVKYNNRIGGNPIQEILTFLDGGLSQNNTIVTAICNDVDELPDTLLNRPGRFELILKIDQLEDIVIIDFINTLLPEHRRNTDFANSVLNKALLLQNKTIDYIRVLVYSELAELIEYEDIVDSYK